MSEQTTDQKVATEARKLAPKFNPRVYSVIRDHSELYVVVDRFSRGTKSERDNERFNNALMKVARELKVQGSVGTCAHGSTFSPQAVYL